MDDTLFTDAFWNTTTDAFGNSYGDPVDYSNAFTSDWLGNLATLATTGLGVWGTIAKTDAQNDLAKAQIRAQQQQAQTSGQFWATVRQFLPWIIGGVIIVAAVVLLRRKD